MKTAWWLLPIVLVIVIAIYLATDKPTVKPSSQEPKEVQSEILRVGFSQAENNNPWRIAETNSIKEEANKRGFDLIYTDAQSSSEKQINDVKEILSKNIDYLILAPRQYDELAPALQMAKDKNVPVILIDREAKGIPGEDFITFIGANFIWEGEQAAKWLVEKMNGKANIVEISATTNSTSAKLRAEGFRNIIDRYPDMKIITSQSGESSRATGQKVMEQIIKSADSNINAVYSHADESTIGAIQALKAAGIKPGIDTTIVSVDGQKDALKAIIAGELGATVECSPFLGPKAFDVIEDHLEGKKIPTRIIQPGRFFTGENAETYINQSY
ncbi:ABC transporter substrate-binding protein [Bacillus sp. JJ1609]|uniref:ABC transporter substrate-binding protein n=1 Tax=Bacillus sp. JJ1609 TaxID=3122977 RepID=UPI002FFEF678